MHLNLRKARKLENKIQKHLETKKLNLEVNLRIKGSLDEAKAALTSGGNDLLNALEQSTKLNDVRFSIRQQIARANETAGINSLMNQREALKARTQFLSQLLTAEVSPKTDAEITDLLASNSKAVDAGQSFGYGRDSVNVKTSVITDDVRISLNQTITATVKGLEDLEDQLAQKNLGSLITLDENAVNLLQSAGLL